MVSRSKRANVIRCEGHEIPYELVRRRRVKRNLYLDLDENGELQVIVPQRASARAVHETLQAKQGHILDFMAREREKRQAIPSYRYRQGEKHLYLGVSYPLEMSELKRGASMGDFDGKRIVLPVRDLEADTVREALRRWYRQRALQHFQLRLEHFSTEAEWVSVGVPPLRIRRMKRTTGSCSRSGLITMNPHMVKAPPFLVDYVIAHEVCHLQEHNHGPGFYRLMDGLFPRWKEARAELRRDWLIYRAE